MASLDAENGQLTDDQVEQVNDNLPLAYSFAAESKERRIDLDDRRQAACLGLIDAVLSHDPAKGGLATHAAWCIRGEIQRAARKAPPLSSIDAMAEDGFEPTDQGEILGIDPDDAERLTAIVAELPDDFRKPIVDHYYRGRKPRGHAKGFEAGAIRALRLATWNGKQIPPTPPRWMDPRTGEAMHISRPSPDDAKAMRAMQGLKLMPVFPTVFTPTAKCPHDGPIPAGSKTVCMVCNRSGLDGIVIPDDVAPLPADKPKLPPPPPKHENRKERRKRQRTTMAKAG